MKVIKYFANMEIPKLTPDQTGIIIHAILIAGISILIVLAVTYLHP